ncbi:TolC family protein [Parabacteroides distasonis]|uniref:TolC family protein n=1 Tax=Parabacteroides distasonis TaxID=823 RepID=UPI00325B69D2
MRKTVIYVMMYLVCGVTAAQTPLTLDECRSMALKNNVKMRNASNEVEAAVQGQKEAFTNYFPNVSASGMAYNANKGLLQMEMGPGMSMSLLKNGIMGGITVTQPVFAGGQIVNSNRLAAVGVEMSKVQREQSENEVRLTVEQYFWQVVTLLEKLNTLRTVEKQLESIQRDVETAVNAGITTRNDLLQVQLRHNDIASTRINLENNLHVCRMMLAQYIGLDADTVAVECSIPMDAVPDFPNDIYCDHAGALPQTTGYRLLESNVRASRLQQKMTVGKNLPSVAVGAGYMYDNLMDKSHPFAVGFVSVSVPLSGWWGGSHAIKKQKLQVMNAENRLADNSELLVIAMQKAWTDLQDAYKQILIAHNSIEQSTENLRLNEDYYHAGTTTMSDLLDAQTLFRQSRDRYAEAWSQYEIKKTEYLQATGR